MKVLVTGGAGFIGSHLVDRLIADGHAVTVLDNLATGRLENLKASGVEAVQADIRDIDSITGYFLEIDWVFHLAALADIVPSIVNPMNYFTTNVTGTANVLEASRKAGVKRFIYSASSSCYGIPDQFPTPETSAIRCEYPYAMTKFLGEQSVMHWGKIYDLPVVSLRFFNVYGPRIRTNGTYGAVFGVFLSQSANGKPLTVVGDGTQTRDFTYVTDVVDALVRAAGSDVAQCVMNVGSGQTVSVNRLTELIGGETVSIPKRPGEPECTFADITQIQQKLKWEPQVRFETGVKRMLESLEGWKNAPLWTPDTIQEATEDWFKYLVKN